MRLPWDQPSPLRHITNRMMGAKRRRRTADFNSAAANAVAVWDWNCRRVLLVLSASTSVNTDRPKDAKVGAVIRITTAPISNHVARFLVPPVPSGGVESGDCSVAAFIYPSASGLWADDRHFTTPARPRHSLTAGFGRGPNAITASAIGYIGRHGRPQTRTPLVSTS
jgi:hypothetical protein